MNSIYKIIDQINDFIMVLWQSTYAFWATVAMLFLKPIKKVLFWCGGILAEGAIKKFVEKCAEVFNLILDEKLEIHEKKIEKKLDKRLKSVEKSVDIYKRKKHDQEGELKTIKQVIKDNDIEALEAIRETILEDEKQ